MKLHELRSFAGTAFREKAGTARFMAFSFPAVWVIFKAVPDLMAAALIFRKQTAPAAVFFSRDVFWSVFLLLWNILSFCILIPMLCTVCAWFSEQLGFGRKKYFFGHGKYYWKSLWFFGKVEFFRFVMLAPFLLSCFLTAGAFRKASVSPDSGLWVFLMIQCLAAAFWMGYFYLRFCAGLCAVPFLFLENPKISAFRAVKLSGNILHHQYRKLFLILLTGLFLPKTAAMLILFLQIRIREYFRDNQY